MDFKISFYYDKLLTSEHTLIVYKDLLLTTETGKYLSYTRRFPYERDYEYIEDSLKAGRQQNRLTYGFRCYTELGAAIGRANSYGGVVIYVAIPAGSKHYINRLTSEICADTILIQHECWRSENPKVQPYIHSDFEAVPEWGIINTIQ